MFFLSLKFAQVRKVFLRNGLLCDDFFELIYRLALVIISIGSIGYPIISGKTDFFDTSWRFFLYVLLVASCFRKFSHGLSAWLIPILIYGTIQLAQTSGSRAAAWSYALGLVFLAFLLSCRDVKAYRIIYWTMAFSIMICFLKVFFCEFIVHGGRSSSGENVNVFGVNCAFFFAVLLTASLDVRIGFFQRLLVSLGVIAANACVVMSGSRAALLAIVSIQGALLLISLVAKINGVFLASVNFILSCVGWGAAFGLQRSATVLADFNAVLDSSDSASSNARVEFWKTAWKLIQKNPLSGFGENAWRPTLHALQSEGTFPSSVQVLGHAHNEILNAAFCYGVPFVSVYLMVVFYYSRFGLRRLRRGFDAGAMLAVFTMIVIVSFGMFESVFWHPECVRLNFVFGFMPLIVLLASSQNTKNPLRGDFGESTCGDYADVN